MEMTKEAKEFSKWLGTLALGAFFGFGGALLTVSGQRTAVCDGQYRELVAYGNQPAGGSVSNSWGFCALDFSAATTPSLTSRQRVTWNVGEMNEQLARKREEAASAARAASAPAPAARP